MHKRNLKGMFGGELQEIVLTNKGSSFFCYVPALWRDNHLLKAISKGGKIEKYALCR